MTNTREERVARAMSPSLFSLPDELVGPATLAEREKLRRYASIAIAALSVEPSPDVWEALRSARRAFERLMMIAGDGTAVSLQAAAEIGAIDEVLPDPPNVTVEEDRA